MEGDFSQRMGFRPLRPEIQLDDMSTDLHVSIWNALSMGFLSGYRPQRGSSFKYVKGSNRHYFAIKYYSEFQKTLVDYLPSQWSEFVTQLRKDYFKLEWHDVYSLMEFVIANAETALKDSLTTGFNEVLEREGSGYRVVDGKVCPITSPEEMAAVEEALEKGSAYSGISEHLGAAIRMLSDKQSPDYRNSIKESISAVESVARHITGDSAATLGQAIKVLEKKHNLHESLKRAFSALYGYTNDADGIRHSLMDDGKSLTSADARFMLITCSAFINFVIDSTKD
jgi:hypothetical protein